METSKFHSHCERAREDEKDGEINERRHDELQGMGKGKEGEEGEEKGRKKIRVGKEKRKEGVEEK